MGLPYFTNKKPGSLSGNQAGTDHRTNQATAIAKNRGSSCWFGGYYYFFGGLAIKMITGTGFRKHIQ
jgi:hypothetical protein